MPKIQFLGRVLPGAAVVTIQTPDLKWKWQELGLEPEFKVKIDNSVINIECNIARYQEEYFIELYKRASDLARAAVNVVGFSSGLGLSVVLDTAIKPDGISYAILPNDPSVPSLCTAYGLDPARAADLDTIFRMALSEPALFRALNDLVESITVFHVACVNCGRVIESIRRMISPNVDGAQAWQATHRVPNISRSYQEWISDQAKGPRHADPAFVPGNITTEVTHRTWTVMNRFLEYRKRGDQPLSAPDFPLLQ